MSINDQIQVYSDTRSRRRAEVVRDLLNSIRDDISVIDDIYSELVGSPTWVDNRPDAPPHLLVPSDLLGINTFLVDLEDFISSHGQLPIVLKATVQPA